MQYFCVTIPPTVRPTLYMKDGYGIFNVYTNLGACCHTHKGGSGTNNSAQELTHPALPGDQIQGLRIWIPTPELRPPCVIRNLIAAELDSLLRVRCSSIGWLMPSVVVILLWLKLAVCRKGISSSCALVRRFSSAFSVSMCVSALSAEMSFRAFLLMSM